MADQLSDIRQLVFDRLAASGNDTLFSPDVVDRAINASNKRLGREHDWPWLIDIGTLTWTGTTISATLDLSAAITNFRHLKFLADNNGRKLKYESPQAFVQYNQDTGDPRRYTVVGSTLYVSPFPTASTTLRYVAVLDENDLGDDRDTPLLPAAYTDLLVLKTCHPLAVRAADTNLLNMIRAEYKNALDEARDEVRRTRQLPGIDYDKTLWQSV